MSLEERNTVSDNQTIIEDLFGSKDKIPVFDTQAYELPNSFWLEIKEQIDEYSDHKHDGLYRLIWDKLVGFTYREYTDNEKEVELLRSIVREHTGITDEKELDSVIPYSEKIENLEDLNNKLCEAFRENGHRIWIDLFVQREQQRFSQFKRNLVRDYYYEWDTRLTDTFFKDDAGFIDYPLLMIDRLSLQVYSRDYLTFNKTVRETMHPTDFMSGAACESVMYKRYALRDAGYSEKDVNDFGGISSVIEDEFDFMKHRSILPNFKLTEKPKLSKDAYWWKEDGITYKFKFDKQSGAPLSMFLLANIQRLVYWRLKDKYPEIEEAYNEELLEETNFIPMGWEEKYLKYEKIVLDELKDTAKGTYMIMLERLGFASDKVRSSELVTNLHQIEVCMNTRLPLDPINYMQNRASNYYSYGLTSCRLDYNTPLFVTKYSSDIEPNVVRFAHKIYRKTKRNLRHEIVLGKELKQKADVGTGRMPIGEYFFVDSANIKKYLYAKLVFHHIRRTEGFDKELYQRGYHGFDNCELEFTEDDKRRVMAAILNDASIPEVFKDLDLFSNFVKQLYNDGFVNRGSFRCWTDHEFRKNVGISSQFERMSRGRYRVRKDSPFKAIIKDFKRVDKQLSLSVDLDAVDACEGNLEELF